METETWETVDKIEMKCDCPQDDCNAELYTYDDHIQIESDNHLSTFVMPDGYAVCQRVEPEAITQQALQREPGWEYMQWNGVTDEWYKQFAPPRMGHSNCVGVRFKERKNESPDKPTVYIFLSNSYVHAIGVKTMADLRTLVRFLSGGAE